jgi:hypothetical protein
MPGVFRAAGYEEAGPASESWAPLKQSAPSALPALPVASRRAGPLAVRAQARGSSTPIVLASAIELKVEIEHVRFLGISGIQDHDMSEAKGNVHQQHPKWKYHRTGKSIIVQNSDAEAAASLQVYSPLVLSERWGAR